VRLGKLEAARRQLETAIKLYFADGDEVSIHTLTGAAYPLIRDINEHRLGEPWSAPQFPTTYKYNPPVISPSWFPAIETVLI
jgi:hypothetical protein